MTDIKLTDVMKRSLPSFREWIEKHSPGTQAEGFEAMADLSYRSQGPIRDDLPESAKSFARMWMGASVAAVELCNMEAVKYGRSEEEIIALLPRVFATATMYALASACKPDTPWRRLAKVVTEEFRTAAKITADTLTEQMSGADE